MIYILSIYFLVFLLSFTDFSKKYNNLGVNLSIILLSILAGFRHVGGKDFEAYRYLYETGLSIGKTEVGYNLTNTFFHSIGFSYNIFLFIISFISLYILIKSFQKISIYPKLSLLLYMGTYFFFYNMVLNRQMIAVSLLLWIIFLWDKNKIYSLILLFVAFSFHKSIIIILPFLFIFDLAKNKKYIWMFLFIIGTSLALFVTPQNLMDIIFSGETMVNDRIGGYLLRQENNIVSYNVEIFEYIKLLVMILIIIPITKRLYKDIKTSIWLFFYFIGAIFLIWSSKYEIMFRLFMYFDLSFIILLPYCLEIYLSKLFLSKKQSKIIKIFVYCLIGVIAISSIYYRASNFSGFSEYKFYFMENL